MWLRRDVDIRIQYALDHAEQLAIKVVGYTVFALTERRRADPLRLAACRIATRWTELHDDGRGVVRDALSRVSHGPRFVAGKLASPKRIAEGVQQHQLSKHSSHAGHRKDAVPVPRSPRSGEQPAVAHIGAQYPDEGAPARVLPRAAAQGRQDDRHLPGWRPGIRRQRQPGD